MKKIILILSFLFVTISGYSQVDQIFWFAAPSVTAAHGDLPIELRLASFNSVPANVTIDVPADNSFAPINITIAPMGSSLVDLSAFLNLLENRPNNTILNKGIRITATQPITAYYEVDRGGLNNEIFTLKGENALGTRFYTPFQTRYPINQNYYENASDPANSSFTIVATAPGATTVTIRLKAGKVAKGGTAAPQANSDFIITLNQGQTYTVFADGRLGVDRLDGTLITSDKAIAVTICDDSIEHPSIGAIDLTGDQIVPVNIVGDASGSEYLIARGFAGNNNDENIAYIVGTEANTQVTLNAGTTTATTVTIGAGQTYEYILSPEFVASKVVSTKPVYVLYLSGFGGELGSPLLPSIKCTGSSKVSFVRSSGNSFFLVILVQTEAIGSFTLEGYNNSVIVNEGYSSIPATTTSGNWSVKQIEVTDIEVGKAYTLSNTKGYFHLGIINGVRGGGSANFGYFSDFGKISTNLPGSLDICPNTSVKLDPQIFGYRSAKWYKNNQPISGGVGPNGELTFLADPNNSTGEYRVELEDNRSCKINDTVKIKVFPRIGFTLPAPPTNVCSNANYAINAPGDYVSYQWKFGTLATLSPITSNNGPKSHKPDKSGTYRVIITDLNGCKDSSQVVINYITTQLVKLNDPTSSFCSNGSSILTHQTPPTTFNSYLWKYNNSPAPGTNNEKTYRPNFTTSGSYTITLDVTDANGCASSDSKTINFVSNQGFNLGEDQTVVCTNSNYSIVVNGNYTNLIWDLNGAIFTPTSGAGGKTHKPVQGKNGTYTVKGKDVNGCDATDAVVIGKVVDSTGITLNTPPNNVCSNSGFQLEVSPGTLSSYTWYKGTTQVGTSSKFRPTSGGTYTVVAIDANTCRSSKSANINYVDTIALNITPPPSVFCANNKIYVIDAGNSFTSYVLKLNNQVISFSNPPSRHRPTVGGNYLVEATDSKGCISRDDVFINYKDTANFKLPAVPAVVCENANGFNNTYIIEAGGSYPTYTWSKDGVNFNPSIPPNKHKPNSRGTYKVTIADINGCPASDQVFVNYFVPTALKLNSNPAGNISCWNKLTTLTPTPGFNPYVWTTNNGVNIPINTGSITPKQSGTYSVVGTDLNGCKSGDQASITFVPDFNLELGDIRATCSNVTYKIDATKPNIVSYVWTTSAGVSVPDNRTSVFEVNKPGFYSVKLTDNNGCTDQDTLEVKVTDKIIVNLGADRPECFNNRVPLNATPNFAKYEWTNSAGVTNPGLTTSQFFPTKTGNYSVKVTDASGNCTDEDTVSIVFVPDFGFELKNNPNEVICYNIGGSIESKDPKYNTGYQWNWSVPSGEPQPANNVVKIDPKTSGRYIIKIVDPATLCDDRDTVDITYSNLTLGYNLGDPNKRVCFNIMDSITSTLPKFRDKSQYTWDWPLLPAQFPNSDGKTVVFPTKSGKYAARITDIYRCTALDTVDVNFISDFNSNLDKGNKFVCADSAYTLNAGPGFDYYNWQGGPQGPNLPTYTPPRKDGRYYVTVTKVGCNKKDSVDLTFVPAIKLNLNLSGDHYICYEDPGVLTVSEGFDSYTWSGSTNTTNTYTPPKVNGDYIVTVKLKTCPASDTASLTFVPDFRIAPWNPGIVCGEDSISLSGGRTGGFIFDWQDGSHDTIYYPRASGTVRLVKTDILSKCKAEQSTLIDFVTRPKDFDVPDANKCPERSITITATGSEFTRFVWGENSPNPFTTRNPGIFYVEGFTAKGNCGFKDTVTVRNFALDTLDLGYDETKPVIVCSYDRFTLHAGPEYKSYKWFPGGSEDSTFVPTSSGPQQVNVVDKNDCQQTDLMLLTINKVDKPDLGKDTILCSSTDYALLIPPNKYTFIEWNDKTSNTKYTPKGGDSLITVKVSKKLENVECFNGDSAIVRVARPFNLNIGKDTIVCSGSEFLLDPKKDYYTYDWKYTSKVILDDVNDSFLLVSQKKTLKPDTTGNYRLIVSGEFNCKDSAGIFIDYFKFTPPVPQTPSICIGETATFNGGSNYNSYIWKNTSGTIVGRAQFLSTKIGGTYTLILEKEECLIHDTTEVTLTTRALPAIRSLLNDTNTILNKRLTLCYDVDKIERILAVGDTSYQYRWSILPDTNQFVSNINVVDLQLGGTYHISVMDTTGCKFSDTVLVAFTDSCFRIPNLFTPNFDERNDKFQVKGIRANTWDLSVFNRWGDKVYYEEGYNNTWDGGNVTDGIYYYLLENPKDNKSYKGWLQIIGRKD